MQTRALNTQRAAFRPARTLAAPIRSARSRTSCVVKCAAFPWSRDNYLRLAFCPAPHGPMRISANPGNGSYTGVLVFKRHPQDLSLLDDRVLEIFVAGDTAVNLYTALHNTSLDRPMTHDLLNTVVSQLEGMSLLHVAVVALKEDVFIGRLFFGCPDTGNIIWDCDCRPSDGCFLSIKKNVPLYVHSSVWSAASKPLLQSAVHEMLMEQKQSKAGQAAAAAAAGAAAGGEPGEAASQLMEDELGASTSGRAVREQLAVESIMAVKPDDPEAILLLKRELEVAVQEEDYQTAIRLRDHPWMKLYKEVHFQKMIGHHADATRLWQELRTQISLGWDM